MLRAAARAAGACGSAAGVAAASAPTVLSGDDSALLSALTPEGVTLAVDAGWTQSTQRVQLSCPREGLRQASVELEGSLLRLLSGSAGNYSACVRGRGVVVRSDGVVQLELKPGGSEQADRRTDESSSSDDGGGGGGGGGGLGSLELALRLPVDQPPSTLTVEIEDTSAASVELLEQLSSLHPFAADIIMAGAGPAATASPITVDPGARLRLLPGPAAAYSATPGGNCPRASMISASGSVSGRSQHPVTLRHSGGWVNRLLLLLADSGLSSEQDDGGRNGRSGGGGGGGGEVEVDVNRVQLAHSALRWRMEDGTVHFSRADLLINQQVRLASFGSYTFTGHGRKIEAVLAVPAVTLRQIKLLAPALTDDREGIVLKAALTLPEPPPRGYYLRRNAEASSGGQGQGDEEAVGTKVDALRHAGAASTIDWLEAVDWGAVVTQLGALSARGMAAQLKKSTQYTRRSAGSLDPRLLANVVGAVVHETAPRPELLPPAPPIPGVCRS
jgi:hypothetical protein